MEVHSIRIAVEATSAGVAPGLNAGLAALQSFQRSADSTLKKVGASFAALPTGAKIFGGLTVAAGLLATGLGAVITPAIEFESAFAGVRKTVNGSESELGAIREELLSLSRVMPTSAADLASIAENAGQLGVAAGDVVEFTTVIAQLGETTDLDFDSAAQSFARFLNVTEGGVGNIGSASDALVELGNNSATTESQILDFAQRTASAGTAIGLTSDELLGFAASFSSLGLRAEAGGSAFSRVLITMRDATINAGAELDVFSEITGLLPQQFQRLVESSPEQAILAVGAGLNRITEEGGSTSQLLFDLGLQGLRTSELLRLLAGSNEFVAETVALGSAAAAEGGARLEEYGRRVETTASQIDIFRNRLNVLAIEAGTPFLDGVITAVNLLGDAIEGTVRRLAPLGSELTVTFANMGEAASVFFDVLGRPALAIAIQLLNGLANGLTSVLQVLNSLGPAGIVLAVLAADIALVGPASVVAVAGLSRLGITVAAVGANSAGAAAGLTSATVAANGLGNALAALYGAAGVAVLVAGIVQVQRALGTAREEADELARAMGDDLVAAVGDVDQVEVELGQITGRLEEARAELAAMRAENTDNPLQSWLGNFAGMDEFNERLAILGQSATDGRSELLELDAEIAALEELLADTGLGNYTTSLDAAANRLGITRTAAEAMAIELGVLEDLTQGNTAEMYGAIDAMVEYSSGIDGIAERTGLANEEILSSTLSIEDWANAMGLTGRQLEFLADKIDGVDVEGLLGDPDEITETENALASIVAIYDQLAASVDLTTGAYINQLQAAQSLTAATSELESAMQAARDTAAALADQQNLVAEANAAVEEATRKVNEELSDESVAQLADSYFELTLAQAANADSADEVAAIQARLAAEFVETALEAGATREQVAILGAELFNLPTTTLLEVFLEGQQVRSTLDEINRELDDVARRRLIELGVIDEATPDIIAVLENLRLMTDDPHTAALAAADAGSLGLISEATSEALAYAVPYVGVLDADGELARIEIELVSGQANDYAAADFGSLLTADGSQALAETLARREDQRAFADAEYLSFLTTDGSSAEAETSARRADQNAWAAADYGSFLTADGTQAAAETETRRADALNYRNTDYTAQLTANDRASTTINTARSAALIFAGTYTAELRARDLATSVIEAANRVLGRFTSRSINLTANYRTTGGGGISGNFSAAGGLVGGSSARSPLMSPTGPIHSAVLERAGVPKVYGAMPYGQVRIHSEHVTGGEAYIPLDPKTPALLARARSLVYASGAHLGMFADGGITGTRGLPRFRGGGSEFGGVIINAPISIQLDTGGRRVGTGELESLRRIVEQSVDQALSRAGRDYANRRLR